METKEVYRKEVLRHQKRYRRFVSFTHSSTKAAAIMLLAAVVALVIANTDLYGPFRAFWDTEVGFTFGEAGSSMPLGEVVNDILMAVFFLLVGLEIKYEMRVGELTNIRQAILPILAAVGGVLMPIVIYTAFNLGHPETARGWGVPTATDIAFALGILSLLGNRVPSGVRVFLSTLAVADDIIAIIVIAVFYGQTPSPLWLAAALLVVAVLVGMNYLNIYSLGWYIVVGGILWFCVFRSGIHPTIAGVVLAFTIPSGSRIDLKSFSDWSRERTAQAAESLALDAPVIGQQDYLRQVSALSTVASQVVPPATRLEKGLYPWVYFLVMPLFALTNADVCLAGVSPGALFVDPAFLGVAFGLLLGKPLGIMLMSFIVVKSGLASLPENVNWGHMLGAAILGGVGFTMAIFVANLAYTDPAHIVAAKTAILCASGLSGIVGFFFLAVQARVVARAGKAYVKTGGNALFDQTADAEMQREAEGSARGRSVPSPAELLESFRRTRRANREFSEAMTDIYEESLGGAVQAADAEPRADADADAAERGGGLVNGADAAAAVADAVDAAVSAAVAAGSGDAAAAVAGELDAGTRAGAGARGGAGAGGSGGPAGDADERLRGSIRLIVRMMERKNVEVTHDIVSEYLENMPNPGAARPAGEVRLERGGRPLHLGGRSGSGEPAGPAGSGKDGKDGEDGEGAHE